MRNRLIAAAAGMGLAATFLPGLSIGARAGIVIPCSGSDWPMFGHDIGRSFASPDRCITNVTAATLAPKWFFNTSSPVTAEPTVAGNTVYAGAYNGTFYAVNAADGTKKWTVDVTPFDHDKVDYGTFPDAAAVTTLGSQQMVVVGGGDTVFVFDATDGTILDKQCLDRVDPTCQGGSGIVSEIESSPAIVPWTDGNALVLVGQDANEADPSGVEGMVALVLSPQGSLTPLWQFDPETRTASVGLAPVELSGPTGHSCGDVWASPAVDLTTRTVVFGTGNCNHPRNDPTQVESTFAIDLDTGAFKWQASPHPAGNGLDLDFGASPNMLGGGLVGEGGKDGAYYAYNIASGPGGTNPSGWNVTVSTGANIGGMIPSPAVGQITTATGTHQAIFADTAVPVSSADAQGSVQNDVLHPTQALGVHAIDAVTHQVVWDAPAGPSYGAAVYDNGVVFTPETFNDALLVLDANTGAPLRLIPLSSPPSSPVAISGDSVYEGAGTTEKGAPGLGSLGGIWALQTAA